MRPSAGCSRATAAPPTPSRSTRPTYVTASAAMSPVKRPSRRLPAVTSMTAPVSASRRSLATCTSPWRGAVEPPLLARVAREQPVPVEIGPALRFHERGRLGDGLGAELGDEARKSRNGAERRREAVELAVVPAEVEVRVGTGAPEAGQDAR